MSTKKKKTNSYKGGTQIISDIKIIKKGDYNNKEMKELLLMLENLSNEIDSFFSRLSRRQRTPQHIRNARAMRKWWRSFKKEGELMIPFILGIIVLGAVGFLAIHLG